MRTLKWLLIPLLFISMNFGHALAETARIDGLLIRPGDTVDKVKEVYQTKLEPEPNDSATEAGSTSLRLKTKGVWFFFNKDSKIYTIRLDAPFPGTISGVKIGDTTAKLLEVLGPPVKTVKPLTSMVPHNYIYYLDDETTANFAVNSDDQIETVFLVK